MIHGDFVRHLTDDRLQTVQYSSVGLFSFTSSVFFCFKLNSLDFSQCKNKKISMEKLKYFNIYFSIETSTAYSFPVLICTYHFFYVISSSDWMSRTCSFLSVTLMIQTFDSHQMDITNVRHDWMPVTGFIILCISIRNEKSFFFCYFCCCKSCSMLFFNKGESDIDGKKKKLPRTEKKNWKNKRVRVMEWTISRQNKIEQRNWENSDSKFEM